jgi:uncharacterized protein YunC (DUF1805 family)
MSIEKLNSRQQTMRIGRHEVLGCSYRWPGGQYCAIHTDCGILACGIFDCKIASEFGIALAIARGTPTNPLCEPEDLLQAKVAEVSLAANALGIKVGMTGTEALEKLCQS